MRREGCAYQLADDLAGDNQQHNSHGMCELHTEHRKRIMPRTAHKRTSHDKAGQKCAYTCKAICPRIITGMQGYGNTAMSSPFCSERTGCMCSAAQSVRLAYMCSAPYARAMCLIQQCSSSTQLL